MHPNLVESNIKNILNQKLEYCKNLKNKYYCLLYNILCFLTLSGVIFMILYSKYRHKNSDEKLREENKKRDYILYNLRKFQNIKNSHISNIPHL